jgi:hypothetical protein
MPDNDVENGLDQFDKELDKYLAIKRKIEDNFVKEPNEDSQFQLDLLKLQLKYDTANLVMTVILSLVVSLLAVLATIIYSGVFPQSVASLASNAFIALIVLTVLVSIIIALIARLGQNIDLNKLRDKYAKSKTKQEEKKP